MAVPPATALHMGYSCMIPACQHYPAMLLPLALSHLESSARISAEGSVSHSVCGSQTVSLQKERKGKERKGSWWGAEIGGAYKGHAIHQPSSCTSGTQLGSCRCCLLGAWRLQGGAIGCRLKPCSRRSSQFSDRSGLHQRAGRHEVEVAETEQFLQDTRADIASRHHTFTGAHRSRWFWSWCS